MIKEIGQIVAIILLPVCFGKPSDCTEKRHSCQDIKDVEGFKYPYDCPTEGHVGLSLNKIVIATREGGKLSPNPSEEVIEFSNISAILKYCVDLEIECMYTSKENQKNEPCLVYIVSNETTKEAEDDRTNRNSTHWTAGGTVGEIVGGIVGGIASVIVGGLLIFVIPKYFCWKRDLRNQDDPALRCSFASYLLKSTLIQRVICSCANRPIRNLCGGGGNDAQQDIPLQSIDSQSDGNASQPLRLDSGLSNGRLVPTAPDNITACTMNRTSSHQSVNGSASNGWTPGDHDAEDHENERRSLLNTDGATVQTSDMTSEAAASVNEPGFDPDQHGRCSPAPEFDVQSTTDVESTTNNKEDKNDI